MNPIEELTSQLNKLPGIGPRQAKRIVYALLKADPKMSLSLASAFSNLRKNIHLCSKSYSYFYSPTTTERLSPIERNPHRDGTLLMIVEKDTDLENVEKSGVYNGKYFVLGGTLPILEKDPEKKIRIRELLAVTEEKAKNEDLKEVIIATSANPEGENTAHYLQTSLTPLAQEHHFTLSILGRGLSTGTELEYSDKETLRSALSNRK